MNCRVFFVFFLFQMVATYCPPLILKNGRIRARHRGKFVRFFCNSGFTLAGDRYATCERYGWDSPVPKCVRPTCPKLTQSPLNGFIHPTHNSAVLNFYCRSGYTLLGPSATFCDGRKWDSNLPTCVATNTKPQTYCDFESDDICGWTHDLNHDFDWRRENLKTPSGGIGTGPSYDHTKGIGQDGYYMYIESSSRSENDTARLISPVFEKSDEDVCFEFFYHMFGATTGTLRAYMKKTSKPWDFHGIKPFFQKYGNQGNTWYRGYFNLGPISDDFQIIVEGVRGPGYVSDMAIDDVKIIEHCVYQEFTTENTYYGETEQVLATVESCENRCAERSFGNESNSIITCDCDEDCYDRNRCCPDYIDFCMSPSSMYTENFYITTETGEESTVVEKNATRLPIVDTTMRTTATVKTTPKPTTTTYKPSPKTNRTVRTTAKTAQTTPKTLKTTPKTVKTVKTTPKTTPKLVKTTPKTTQKLVKTTPKVYTAAEKGTNAIIKQKTSTKAKTRPPLIIMSPPTTPLIVQKVITKTTAGTTAKPKKVEPEVKKSQENEVFKNNDLNDDEISLMDKYYDDEFDNGLDYPIATHFQEKHEIYLRKNDAEHDTISVWTIISIGGGILFSTSTLALIFLKYYRSRQLRRNNESSRSQSDVRFLTQAEVLDFSLDNREDDDSFYKL